jgi:hypothetical protein
MTAYPCCCFSPGIKRREKEKKVNKLVNNLNLSPEALLALPLLGKIYFQSNFSTLMKFL